MIPLRYRYRVIRVLKLVSIYTGKQSGKCSEDKSHIGGIAKKILDDSSSKRRFGGW